jgi:hypothetical protein
VETSYASDLLDSGGGYLLVVSEAAVTKHVGNIFAKLGFTPGDDRNRRVLATLTYLRDGARLNRS